MQDVARSPGPSCCSVSYCPSCCSSFSSTEVSMRLSFALASLLCASIAGAGEMNLAVEVPKLNTAEYHRPYVAIWIEREDQSVAANLSVWYETGGRKEGTKYLNELRQWWRRSGREQKFPIDGVTGPTKPVGVQQLKFASSQAPLATLA